jgi:hypothetical protein
MTEARATLQRCRYAFEQPPISTLLQRLNLELATSLP